MDDGSDNAYVIRWNEDDKVFVQNSFAHVEALLPRGIRLEDILQTPSRTSANGSGLLLRNVLEKSRLVVDSRIWRQGDNCFEARIIHNTHEGVWIRSRYLWSDRLQSYVYAWRVFLNPARLHNDDLRTLGNIMAYDRFYPLRTGAPYIAIESHVAEINVLPSKKSRSQWGPDAIKRARREFVKWVDPHDLMKLPDADLTFCLKEVQVMNVNRMKSLVPREWDWFQPSSWGSVKPRGEVPTADLEDASLMRYLAFSFRRCDLFYAHREGNYDPLQFIARGLRSEGWQTLQKLIDSYHMNTPLLRAYLDWERRQYRDKVARGRPVGRASNEPVSQPKRARTDDFDGEDKVREFYAKYWKDSMQESLVQDLKRALKAAGLQGSEFLPMHDEPAGQMHVVEGHLVARLLNVKMFMNLKVLRWCKKSINVLWIGYWQRIAVFLGLANNGDLMKVPPVNDAGVYVPHALWVLWSAAQVMRARRYGGVHCVYVFRVAPFDVELRKVTGQDLINGNFRIVVALLSADKQWMIWRGNELAAVFQRKFESITRRAWPCGCESCSCESFKHTLGGCPFTKHCPACPRMIVDEADRCCSRKTQNIRTVNCGRARQEERPALTPFLPLDVEGHDPYSIRTLSFFTSDNYHIGIYPLPCIQVIRNLPPPYQTLVTLRRLSITTLLPMKDLPLENRLTHVTDVRTLKHWLREVLRTWLATEEIHDARVDKGFNAWAEAHNCDVPWPTIQADLLMERGGAKQTTKYVSWKNMHGFVAALTALMDRIEELSRPEEIRACLLYMPAKVYQHISTNIELQRICSGSPIVGWLALRDSTTDGQADQWVAPAPKSAPQRPPRAPSHWKGREVPFDGVDFSTQSDGMWPPFLVDKRESYCSSECESAMETGTFAHFA